MKKINKTSLLWISLITLGCVSYKAHTSGGSLAPTLRDVYSQAPESWPVPQVDHPENHQELGVLPPVNFPEDNPYSAEKAALGKMLFFDPRLSASGTIACASCHDPQLGWGDGKSFAFGHERRMGGRNAMTILNTGYYTSLFWEGRATSLEDQAQFPISDFNEMNQELEDMVARLNGIEGYRSLFRSALGQEEVSLEGIQKAIATYERTIVSRKSAFDRFVEGKHDALTDQQIEGLHLFRTKARCINCHNGPLFSDNQFHNLGQFQLGRPAEDLGRYLITKDTADVGKFRTSSLRDIMFTAPWFHNGSFVEMKEIIDMYDRGMPQVVAKSHLNHPLNVAKSPLLQPLNLTPDEKEALMAFLHAISTRPFRVSPPDLPK
jgi:cytochrome c peroxidase